MDVRILDLDGSLSGQGEPFVGHRPVRTDMTDWAPYVRMACSFGRFRQFEEALALRLGSKTDEQPACNFYGSGDFHHVSLALLRRLSRPFNLLVLDNHPDWMRRVPFLHCGTWVYHAAHLPHCQRIFHVGGDVDFDNAYRVLAPWHLLRQGKIVTLPARRGFVRGGWSGIPTESLRDSDDERLSPRRLESLINPHRAILRSMPLYVSIDKDVMMANDAIVNWDSGHLTLAETCDIARAFAGMAGSIAGLDIVGDYSPVVVDGLLRRVMHWTMHTARSTDIRAATRCNERANAALLSSVLDAAGLSQQPAARMAA